MSALAPWAFGRVAPELEARGFTPLPITLPHPSDNQLGKKPPMTLLNWTRPAPVSSRLPHYAPCGTGILTATTPAVDIDVRHPELAETIDRMVVAVIGDGAPVRFGQAPKRLRVCRAAKPFAKRSTAGYRLPGDQPGDKSHKVEVLGAGQQFVAYGVHPDIGRPYAWPDDDLLNLERGDLPELTVDAAAHIIANAEAILARAGTVATNGRQQTAAAGPRRVGPRPRPVRDLCEVRRVFETLKGIDPSTLDYDAWIRVAYGLKAALGERGKGMWLAWSRASTRHDGTSGPKGTPERAWNGVRPQRCGWRYLERLAGSRAHG
jgi:hypothetical protein